MTAPKRCVYTVLTGTEPPAAQPTAEISALPFICFTNNKARASGFWQLRNFSPALPGDLARSAAKVKLQPHRFLPDFEQSLYIAPEILLLAPPEQIFEAADLNPGLCLPNCATPKTLLEDFGAAVSNHLDHPARIAEQLGHYIPNFSDTLLQPAISTSIMLRDHTNQKLRIAMDNWAAHTLRYARPDHLSAAITFAITGLQPQFFNISEFCNTSVDRATAHPFAPAVNTDQLRIELAALQTCLAQLQHEHHSVLTATTWRLLAPLRAALRHLRS